MYCHESLHLQELASKVARLLASRSRHTCCQKTLRRALSASSVVRCRTEDDLLSICECKVLRLHSRNLRGDLADGDESGSPLIMPVCWGFVLMKRAVTPFILLVGLAILAMVGRTRSASVAARRSPEFRRCRVDVDGLGAGVVDDTGPLVFLRGHGQFQECRLDDVAERDRAGCDQSALGLRRFRAGFRRRYWRLGTDRQPAFFFHVRQREQRAGHAGNRSSNPQADGPTPRLLDVPAQVRDHHTGLDHGVIRGTRAIFGLSAVHGPVQPGHLLPAGALDVASAGNLRYLGREGLRRGHRGSHVGRVRGAGRGVDPGPAAEPHGQGGP